ncbi:putative RNA-directed DNA polymerase from transposon X-element [Trichonephila clavata]|uniref:Putative RNA-directed DNA polymerase from transposon X-element n=1 Tax=Trichonephila clavata TaxID=2740835 RepID=A0A8X6J2S0_TRICU|nr:putative RNA-directed DNA polymerase from transposon X-element [Trichonephila clavata]
MNGQEGNCSKAQANRDDISDPSDPPADTTSLPPNVHCARIRTLQKSIRQAESNRRFQQELIDVETFDPRDSDAAQLQSYSQAKGAAELDYNMKMGELKLFFSCPVINCSHNTTNGLNATRSMKKRAAESCILPATFNPQLRETTSKKPKPSETENKNNNKNQTSKELSENTIALNNPFSALNIEENKMEVVDSDPNQAPGENRPKRKAKLIMLRYKTNYNLVLKELNEKYPNSINKLIGEYIRITPISEDQHNEIKNDLANQGVAVSKVAQLTPRKSKFPLPMFLVEVRKNVPDSRDILDVSNCRYMSITWDSFRRRQGATQCYNCNYFHHSSQYCDIKTRRLKCDQEHRTSDCPIKEIIENPECINCKTKGHMANSKQCPKYPKTNPKKGDPIQNNATQNKPNVNQTQNTPKPVTTNNSYANVAKIGHQRSARKTESEPTTKRSEPDSVTKSQNPSSCSEIILAIREFKNFFSNHPELLSLGKALRNATSEEEKVDIFYEAMASTSNLSSILLRSSALTVYML